MEGKYLNAVKDYELEHNGANDGSKKSEGTTEITGG